jgi:hypothetical protein
VKNIPASSSKSKIVGTFKPIPKNELVLLVHLSRQIRVFHVPQCCVPSPTYPHTFMLLSMLRYCLALLLPAPHPLVWFLFCCPASELGVRVFATRSLGSHNVPPPPAHSPIHLSHTSSLCYQVGSRAPLAARIIVFVISVFPRQRASELA